MTRLSTRRSAVIAGALLMLPFGAATQVYDVGDLRIRDPWIRATPNAAPTAAGYLTVINRGRETERLLGGSSPLAQAIEPHTMSMAGGVMRMRLAEGGLEIAPGATLTLAPGGDHLMLVGPKHPLRPGERVPATLRFARAGAVKVEFAVKATAAGR